MQKNIWHMHKTVFMQISIRDHYYAAIVPMKNDWYYNSFVHYVNNSWVQNFVDSLCILLALTCHWLVRGKRNLSFSFMS